jgi:ferritin-like metal-binding protein YciE
MGSTANTPFELLFDQLRDIHSMEIQISESMPRLVSMCTNDRLRALLASHADQNHKQIAAIAAIFGRHGKSPGHDTCKAMAGFIESGTAHLGKVESPETRDLMMIAHCLRIERFEMAAYEFAAFLSQRLGLMREPAVLSDLLAEENGMAFGLMALESTLFEAAYYVPTRVGSLAGSR